MSKKIDQMLLVIRVMNGELKDVYPISARRNRAVNIVASLYEITPSTISDIYIRRLGLGTKDFDDLLTRLFFGKDKNIFQFLKREGDVGDQVSIDKLEKEIENKKVKLSPSILSSDFARLGEQVEEVTRAGADYIHVDVMDGHFVPNITIGPPVVAAIRPHTKLPLDVHLMIEEPQQYIKQFADAGADIITVHIETCRHVHRVVQTIKEAGVKAGVSLNPGTPAGALKDILPYLDLVLVMTVNPGFGGQKFIESMLGKITRLRKELDDRGLDAELEVDGGINAETAPRVVKAGGRVLVAGAAVFNKEQTVAEAVKKLRDSIS